MQEQQQYIKALLIQKNEEDALLFRAMLAKEKWGNFEVEWQDTLSAGMQRLAEGHFDVVLLDLPVPENQGLKTLEKVLDQVPNVPMVVLTSDSDDTLGIEFVNRGAQDYLIKGQVSGNALARVMRYAVERKKLEKALRDSEERYRRLVELSPQAIAVCIEERLVYINVSGAKLLGTGKLEELLGRHILEFVHPDHRQTILSQIQQLQSDSLPPDLIETKIIRLDGTVIDVEAIGAAVTYQHQQAVQLVMRNITERKQVEAQMKASLDEKDVLLKEIHHRVKNNLQVISSLLDLQCRNIKDKETLDAIKESHNRVRSMALVHEKLYQSKDLAKINFLEYTTNLAYDLFHSYGIGPDKIKLKIEADNVLLDIQAAIPCGLIINELISNSLKYAFPQDRKGEIRIALKAPQTSGNHPTTVALNVADNGIGFARKPDFNNLDSLGLRLVNALVYQLKGKLDLQTEAGTEFRISFKA